MNRRRFLTLLGGTGAAGVLASYPVLIEPNIVTVTQHRIALPNLPVALDKFTIVHLTDIHYGLLVPMSLVRRVVDRAVSIPRDLLVCTGDYVHHRRQPQRVDVVWPELSRLTAPYGVLSVLGNHDHWCDTARSQHWLEQTGQDLRHRKKAIEYKGARLWFVGAGDLWEDHMDLDGLLDGIPEEDCRIVLAHNPDTADTSHSKRVDLFICGHTHGGQVRIPFYGAPVLPVKNKNYSSGLKYAPNGTPVFISRGIGWAIYPVRINCTPEIAVIELTRATVPGEHVSLSLEHLEQLSVRAA